MENKETLQEAAERILANNIDGLRDALQDDDIFLFYKGVVQCYGEDMAEYGKDRSYSEEEVIEILIKSRYSEFKIDDLKEWFNQFKK